MESAAVDRQTRSMRKRIEPSDLISNLPRNIVDNILCCLPLKDAARTCILSSKWRLKWLSTPKLVFDGDYHNYYNDDLYESPWLQIYQILLLHHGPVHTFVLSLTEEMATKICFIDKLIRFFSQRDIQELTLCDSFKTKHRLPATLFKCLQLTLLSIQGYTIRVPPQFDGFSRLIHVTLFWTVISANDFKNFIAKCPLLQDLILQEPYVDGNTLEIDALNLKSLQIYDFDGSILLKNVPVLSTFIIESPAQVVGSMPNIVDLFRSIPAIEDFCVIQDSLTDMSGGVIPQSLPNKLNKLKYVELCGLSFNTPKQIKCALLMIRSSPNLERLEIKSHDEDVDNTHTLHPREHLSLVDFFFDHLQQVGMKKFKGSVPELEFLKIILDKSLILKKVVIEPLRRISDKERLKIVEAVVQFERASPKAKIIFVDCDDAEG